MTFIIKLKKLGMKIMEVEIYSLFLNEFRKNLAANLVCHIPPELRSLQAIYGL